MKATLFFSSCLLVASVMMQSCTKESTDETAMSDQSLGQLAINDDFVYANPEARIASSVNSSRIKMNSLAASVYKTAKSYSAFPVNSMIVKEKLSSSGAVSGYDVMLKAPSDPNAVNEWVLTSYDEHGTVLINANTRGVACQGCHNGFSEVKSRQ